MWNGRACIAIEAAGATRTLWRISREQHRADALAALAVEATPQQHRPASINVASERKGARRVKPDIKRIKDYPAVLAALGSDALHTLAVVSPTQRHE